MALLESTLLYFNPSTSLYLTLVYSTLAPLVSTLDSTLLYHGSTTLYLTINHSTMAYFTTWLYFTPPYFYFTLLDSILIHHGSTSVYILTLYHASHSLYFTLYHCTIPLLHKLEFASVYHGSTSLYFTLHDSPMSLLHCTPVYFTLPWLYLSLLYQLRLYFILLDSTLLFHGSSSLYLTQYHSTMGLLHCTSLYFTQRSYTSLYLTQPYSVKVLLHSTWHDLFQLIHKQHQRHTWLSNSGVLIPRAHTNMMSRLFRYTGAVMWNSLPENIKRESTFRAALRCCLASIVLFLWIVEYVLYYNFMFWYVLHV